MIYIEKKKDYRLDEILERRGVKSIERGSRELWIVDDMAMDELRINIVYDPGRGELERILHAVCLATGVDVDIAINGGDRDSSFIRQIVCFLYWEKDKNVQPIIDMFGMSRATVNYSRKQGRQIERSGTMWQKDIVDKVRRVI